MARTHTQFAVSSLTSYFSSYNFIVTKNRLGFIKFLIDYVNEKSSNRTNKFISNGLTTPTNRLGNIELDRMV